MTVSTPTKNSDLQLRIHGGQRDGELISISSEKCLLSFAHENSDVAPKCAIVRGVRGVAVCSFGDEVRVNGASTSVHWLQTGDRIDLPESINAIVECLGQLDDGDDLVARREACHQAAIRSLDAPSTPAMPPMPQAAPTDEPSAHSEPTPAAPQLNPDEEVVYSPVSSAPATPASPVEASNETPANLASTSDLITPSVDEEVVYSPLNQMATPSPEFVEPVEIEGLAESAGPVHQPAVEPAVEPVIAVEPTVLNPGDATSQPSSVESVQPAAGETAQSMASAPSLGEALNITQSEPVQTEPVQTEPVQSEPVQSEPRQPEPVQPSAVQPEPLQADEPAETLSLAERLKQLQQQFEIQGAKATTDEPESAPAEPQAPTVGQTQAPQPASVQEEPINDTAASFAAYLAKQAAETQGSSDSSEQPASAPAFSEPVTESIVGYNPASEPSVDSLPSMDAEIISPAQDPTLDQTLASQHVIPEQPTPDATEPADKLIDNLTHSSLVGGSSLPESLTAGAEAIESPALGAGGASSSPTESEGAASSGLASISEQIKAEISAEAQHSASMHAEVPTQANDEVTSMIDSMLQSLPSTGSEEQLPSDASQGAAVAETSIEEVPQTDAGSETGVPPLFESEVSEASPAEAPTPAAPSVTELLERMKSEGQWGGIPDEDEPAEPVAEMEVVPEPMPEPVADTGEDANVEDYMAQLLSRMRGGSPAEPKPAAPVAQKQVAKPTPEVSENKEVQPSEDGFVPPSNPLTPEEFKPKQRAQRLASLGAMRELANNTARTAIKKSEHERRKALGTAQIAICVASFLMALYFFLFGAVQMFDVEFCIGIVCTLIAGFLAYRFYATMRHNERVDAEERRLKAAKKQGKTLEAAAASPEV